ncbi:hypothetical protein EHO59_09730 [Leptospira semungkisensis]|uniref:Uncharacterized protein n=1 Tax=Leptospira semungkisensis TaxID=2484985 RepID=A0A4R9FXQ0_9LEPT|nr:hypothetical protein [Leptospira semungkisensis]TGK03806.1 hypothetical protein EHO59_09730 [Leptospira semungkisensis]
MSEGRLALHSRKCAFLNARDVLVNVSWIQDMMIAVVKRTAIDYCNFHCQVSANDKAAKSNAILSPRSIIANKTLNL